MRKFLTGGWGSLLIPLVGETLYNLDNVHSLHPSANVLVFRDFIIHHEDWFIILVENELDGSRFNHHWALR